MLANMCGKQLGTIGSHVWQPAVGTIPCQNRAARNSSSFFFFGGGFLTLTASDEG